jgi:hypothetical protein
MDIAGPMHRACWTPSERNAAGCHPDGRKKSMPSGGATRDFHAREPSRLHNKTCASRISVGVLQ